MNYAIYYGVNPMLHYNAKYNPSSSSIGIHKDRYQKSNCENGSAWKISTDDIVDVYLRNKEYRGSKMAQWLPCKQEDWTHIDAGGMWQLTNN